MIIEPYTWHSVTIQNITTLSSDTVTVRASRPDGYHFIAGQYAIIRATMTTKQRLVRQYSLSSASDAKYLEFTVQLEPGGEVSSWFHTSAKVGDKLEVSQAFGTFLLPSHTNKPIIMIAGRAGVAPFISMIRSPGRPSLSLLYCVKNEAQLCYKDELLSYYPRIKTHFFVSDARTRLSAVSLAPYLLNNPTVFICGSRSFVDGVREYIRSADETIDDIRTELFTL